MNIEYKNSEMIITHESGHVVKCQRVDLEKQKAILVERQADLQADLSIVNTNIHELNLSIGAV